MMSSLADKKILFRADSSAKIGTGHIMRTHVLAQELKAQGADVTYACRDFEGHLIDFLRAQGYGVNILPRHSEMPDFDPDDYMTWLGASCLDDVAESFAGAFYDLVVIDHYGAGYEWQNMARAYAQKIMVIDDEAKGIFDCDVLLNQNYCPEGTALYQEKIPKTATALVGGRYALLRKEFAAEAGSSVIRTELCHLLVMMGGADSQQMSRKIAEALQTDCSVTIVVGNAYKDEAVLRRISEDKGFVLLKGVSHVADLMKAADFCIGAGGSTSWERCCMKLPSALFYVAENQKGIAENLEKAGAVICLGQAEDFDAQTLNALLADLKQNPERLKLLSEKSASLADGQGVHRVMKAVTASLS